jgi:predicted glycogen debranching enzyme
MFELGREICGELGLSEQREWLVTNGIGGFASGTVGDVLTRRYHGLLIAALTPPVNRTLLVSKLDAAADYKHSEFSLYTNRWAGGVTDPHGYRHIERFYLDGRMPVWEYALGDALLQKRIWMQHGANTTYLQFRFLRGSAPLTLNARALVNNRDFHHNTHAQDMEMEVELLSRGVRVLAFEGATPIFIFSDRGEVQARSEWYRRFYLMREANRGLEAVEDKFYAAKFIITLQPGEETTFVFSTHAAPNLDGAAALAVQKEREAALLARIGDLCAHETGRPRVEQLVLAADQFLVKRPSPADRNGMTVIAGYPWFADWGRDTMIALPGLTLATGRPEVAAKILRTFAHFIDQGMLPNRFPDAGAQPVYNTVDATLWYFQAIYAHWWHTKDAGLIRELFPILQDIIAWHRRGTRYHIKWDPADGLLYAGEEGQQLTWMDARANDWVVTPRIGKPVEVNALWYNALCIMTEIAQHLGHDATLYAEMAAAAKRGFARFWQEEQGCCADVLDGPDGDDLRLRPNQIFAVSLPFSPLNAVQQKAVVDICAQELLTSHGLRTLSPADPAYIGSYGGDLFNGTAPIIREQSGAG